MCRYEKESIVFTRNIHVIAVPFGTFLPFNRVLYTNESHNTYIYLYSHIYAHVNSTFNSSFVVLSHDLTAFIVSCVFYPASSLVIGSRIVQWIVNRKHATRTTLRNSMCRMKNLLSLILRSFWGQVLYISTEALSSTREAVSNVTRDGDHFPHDLFHRNAQESRRPFLTFFCLRIFFHFKPLNGDKNLERHECEAFFVTIFSDGFELTDYGEFLFFLWNENNEVRKMDNVIYGQ